MTNRENADLFCKSWLEGKSSFTFKTSGSTGTPKIVELRRDQMTASAKKTIEALGLRKGMTSLVCLDVNFIAGSMMLVRSMIAEMNIIVVEPSATPLKRVEDTQVDFAAVVPYQLATVDDRLKGKVIIGGAPVTQELIEKLKRIKNATFYATFGMTETLSHIALQRLTGDDPQEHFHTLQGIKISTDPRQCLVIEADYIDNEVVTNDIVDIISPTEFRWLGRHDNVINSGGIKVTPEKIERIVEEFLLTKNLKNRHFAAGLTDEQLGQQVVLVIEGMLTDEQEQSLFQTMQQRLSRFEVPKKILYNENFAMTLTQKIDRKLSMKNALPRPNP